jgi:chromosome segregation ATPase
MFLVDMSFKTVKREIEELDNKLSRKQTAIETSQAQLDKDNQKLIKFIERDQIKTSKKEKKAKQAMKQSQALFDENKDLDNKINNIRSEISKHKDNLSALDEHKKFLMELSTIHDAAWVAEQKRQKDE